MTRRTYVITFDLTGDEVAFDRHLKHYLTDEDGSFMQDFGPEAWGGYEGPFVTGATVEPQGQQWACIFGDPAQGFTYHGPFATSDEACEYGDLHRGNDADEYWVTPLQQLPPN